MKIAVPVTDDVLSGHFGRCTQFALLEVDPRDVVSAYLAGTLTCDDVPCTDHGDGCRH